MKFCRRSHQEDDRRCRQTMPQGAKPLLYRTNGVIFFYQLLHSSTRHIEKVEGGERDTQLVHVNEAMVA